VKAIKAGAHDFIVKPVDSERLRVVLANAIRLGTLAREVSRLRRDKEGALLFRDLVGHAHGLAPAVGYGRKAARSDVPVLIAGETGVGKELFARAIHGESRRAGHAFIAINCGAIPEHLVESTLFGHEKGAFTGAIARSIGKFREAEGGTIFLDEVGELPLDAQVKLLRVLQQREVEPVGAGRSVKVDVRIISASNRDLKAEVQAGRFREDLYFRLNVLPIEVPPLRARGEDVLALAQYFIERFAATEGLAVKTLSADAQRYFMQYPWPGNVRELENSIHRALVLSDEETIDRAQMMQLQGALLPLAATAAEPAALMLGLQQADGRFKTAVEIEREAMQRVLDHYAGNITRAAEALGMAKSTFYRKIKDAP
jgi:DNA-binding NtrC family response regulator